MSNAIVICPILAVMILCSCLTYSMGDQPARSFPTPRQDEESEKENTKDSEELDHSPPSTYVLVEEKSRTYVPSSGTVATKTPVALRLLPFEVAVVTEQLLISQQAQVLSDALENVSGVATHTGSGVFDYFVIRGFDSLSSGLVLIDGAPEPESTFYHLYNVDRVEVLKGPGGFLYGGNPLAGSVNLVRKDAIFENSYQAGSSFGSFATLRGQLDFNRTNSKRTSAFRLNVFGNRSDGYRQSKDNWQTGINPSASFQLGNQSFLTANFEYVHNRYAPDSGIPLLDNQIPDVPRTQSYQSPFDSSLQNIYRTRLDFTTVLGNSVTLRNKFYYTVLDWRSNGTLFPFVFPNEEGSADVYRNLTLLDDTRQLVGNQTELIFPFRTGEIRHNLLLGLELQRLGDTYTLDVADLPPIDLFNPVETASGPIRPIPQFSQAADTRALVFAPYFLDQISLFDPLTIFVGGRFDALDFRDSLSGFKRNSYQFSPLIGAVYSPTTSLSFYANFGQAFAPPSSRVIAERVPEESKQIEVGAKRGLLGGKALLTMAVYQLQRDNLAIPDRFGITRQTGSQRSRGIEVDLTGELGTGVYLFGSYAYTEATLTEFRELIDPSFGQLPPILIDHSGNSPAFAPRHICNLWLIKEFSGGFSIAAGPRYLSSQFIAADNQYAIDSSLTVDASLAYRLENWRLSLNARNLTGTAYETRGFGSSSVMPANPFAIYLGVDLLR